MIAIISQVRYTGYLVCLLSIRHVPETHPAIRTAITSTPHTAGTTPATSTCVPTCTYTHRHALNACIYTSVWMWGGVFVMLGIIRHECIMPQCNDIPWLRSILVCVVTWVMVSDGCGVCVGVLRGRVLCWCELSWSLAVDVTRSGTELVEWSAWVKSRAVSKVLRAVVGGWWWVGAVVIEYMEGKTETKEKQWK